MKSLFDYEPEKDSKIKENIIFSGSFIIKGEKLIADVRLEFDAKHPKYSIYHKKFEDLIKEAKNEHVLFSYSGI